MFVRWTFIDTVTSRGRTVGNRDAVKNKMPDTGAIMLQRKRTLDASRTQREPLKTLSHAA